MKLSAPATHFPFCSAITSITRSARGPVPLEEAAGQIGLSPFLLGGGEIEVEESVPMLRLEIGAGQAMDADVERIGLFALLPDGFALARGEGGEEIVEALITLIVPVELLADPQQPALAGQLAGLVLGQEGDMGRG